MSEDIYGSNVPQLQYKTVLHKVQHVEPIMVPNIIKGILDRYNKVTLCCELMHINVIGFLNNISGTFYLIVASRSRIYMLIVNLNQYEQKFLILAYPSTLCPRRNMPPIFNDSIRPSSKVSDLPEQLCLLYKFLNQ